MRCAVGLLFLCLVVAPCFGLEFATAGPATDLLQTGYSSAKALFYAFGGDEIQAKLAQNPFYQRYYEGLLNLLFVTT